MVSGRKKVPQHQWEEKNAPVSVGEKRIPGTSGRQKCPSLGGQKEKKWLSVSSKKEEKNATALVVSRIKMFPDVSSWY